MLVGNLKMVVRAGVYGTLLGISGVYADTATLGDAGVVAADAWAFKLTPSYYVTTHEKDATDLNLRANHGPHAIWLGYYQRGSEFEQTRTGYEYTAQIPYGQLVPSLQLATHGFVGGSINAQIGDSIYALLGFGRTNARDYYNLNFDPNDSIVYGLGTRLLPKSTLSIFTVKDNRLHTGQTVTHAVWRMLPDEHQRWTVDLSSKHGRATADDELVSGKALSVTYDYRDIFFRLAQDRKVNFTAEDQTRLSVGLRF
ncbi:hypothetical protein SCT_2144 [Sulfuricella sp. T08]|nr:hypothetical protein SCT_2144 [Sulfuricella sp. T08]